MLLFKVYISYCQHDATLVTLVYMQSRFKA